MLVPQLVTQYSHTQPFYGSMDFVRDNRGEPVLNTVLYQLQRPYTQYTLDSDDIEMLSKVKSISCCMAAKGSEGDLHVAPRRLTAC